MSTPVSWLLQTSVNDGKLDDFRSLMQEMVASTKNEPGALSYEWFLSADGSQCHIYERYADSNGVMEHLGNFGTKFAERFMGCVTPTGIHVYGEPTEAVREAMAGFGPVYLETFGGFTR